MTAPTNNIFSPPLSFQGILSPQSALELRTVNTVSGSTLYIGYAPIENANPALAVWYILKYHYDSNGFMNRQQLPKNGPGFIYIWNNMATYFT